MSNSRECMGVNGKPCSCMQFIKSHIFYYKLPENLYQYYKSRNNPYQYYKSHKNSYLRLKWNEIEALYNKIIITIVPS